MCLSESCRAEAKASASPRGCRPSTRARTDRERGRYAAREPARVAQRRGLALGDDPRRLPLRLGYGSSRAPSRPSSAKQRAVRDTVGAQWFPLRDAIEKRHARRGEGHRRQTSSTPKRLHWDFRSAPGLYLRLRVAEREGRGEPAAAARGIASATGSSAASCASPTPRQPAETPTQGRSPSSRGTGSAPTARRASSRDDWVREVH